MRGPNVKEPRIRQQQALYGMTLSTCENLRAYRMIDVHHNKVLWQSELVVRTVFGAFG